MATIQRGTEGGQFELRPTNGVHTYDVEEPEKPVTGPTPFALCGVDGQPNAFQVKLYGGEPLFRVNFTGELYITAPSGEKFILRATSQTTPPSHQTPGN